MRYAFVFLAACLPMSSSSSTTDPNADDEQYSQMAGQLDKNRSEFLGKDVGSLAPLGNQLFWFDTTSFDPKLDRYDDGSKQRLAYAFSIGSGDDANYRASAKYIVTAGMDGLYTAYDATSANTQIATTTLMPPTGVKWLAYAADGNYVYFVDTTTPGATAVLRWTPGSGAPQQITTLESAGIQIGEFQDFGVLGNTMVFIESGRIWSFDLATNHATWLMNSTETTGNVDIEASGIMFSTASGLEYWNGQSLMNVTDFINKNPFQINATYATAAKYLQDFALYQHYVIYIGNMGVFAYDLTADKIIPVLLEPIAGDLRIDYRYPVVLTDGTAFVTGLTSTDGAVGADGPTYEVDLGNLLH